MNQQEMIRIARQLAAGDLGSRTGRPRQADLRRAISTTYYALFYTLAGAAADTLIGSNPTSRIQSLWLQTYRTLDHGYAKRQCRALMLQLFTPAIQAFARQFVEMQDHRHNADYNPTARFTRLETQQLLEETERLIAQFEASPEQDRRAFAVYVLFQFRSR